MTLFARLSEADQDGAQSALEVIEATNRAALAERFHPSIVQQFIQVPAGTMPGSVLIGSIWTHPETIDPGEPEPPPGPRRLQISPPTFKMLFTPQERLAIRAARSYAGEDEQSLTVRVVIEDWYEIIDDPRLSYVDLTLPQTQAGIGFLVTAGIITQERCDEILTGVAA